MRDVIASVCHKLEKVSCKLFSHPARKVPQEKGFLENEVYKEPLILKYSAANPRV